MNSSVDLESIAHIFLSISPIEKEDLPLLHSDCDESLCTCLKAAPAKVQKMQINPTQLGKVITVSRESTGGNEQWQQQQQQQC